MLPNLVWITAKMVSIWRRRDMPVGRPSAPSRCAPPHDQKGGTAATWPLTARAQPRLPTIGFLGPASASAMSAWTAAFVQRLRELGWIEGRTIAIEYRWGDGRADRLSEIAAEFVRLKVDVIVTTRTAVPLLKQATSTIPIVFTIANDPIGAGTRDEPFAAGRQCHWPVATRGRSRRQAARTPARGGSRPEAVGHPEQCW